jgi:hypothetical protein
LTEQADNWYKLLKEGGLWNAPSEQEEKILALQAEIKNLRKAKKHKGKPFVKKPFKKKGSFEQKKHVTPTAPLEKPSLFFKEPKEDELRKPKTWKDKLWYCSGPNIGGKCDGQYRRHKPADCEGKAHHFDTSKNKSASTKQLQLRIYNSNWQKPIKRHSPLPKAVTSWTTTDSQRLGRLGTRSRRSF